MNYNEEYRDGDWIKENGLYYHICKECNESFKGRRNRSFCTSLCKAKHNNDKRRDRNDESKLKMRDYQKSADALALCYKPDSGITQVTLQMLLSKGFKIGTPTNQVKITNQIGQWEVIGSYAFQRQGDSQLIHIVKVK